MMHMVVRKASDDCIKTGTCNTGINATLRCNGSAAGIARAAHSRYVNLPGTAVDECGRGDAGFKGNAESCGEVIAGTVRPGTGAGDEHPSPPGLTVTDEAFS